MKEAFEKIIERLEEKSKIYVERYTSNPWDEYRAIKLVDAIGIVKQVAEEYSHRNADLVIGDSHSNDGWIPCSERLPEENDVLLISTKNKEVYESIRGNGYFEIPDGWLAECNVLAWQPLPAPYKPKGEEV
jgi:hypothetical protein